MKQMLNDKFSFAFYSKIKSKFTVKEKANLQRDNQISSRICFSVYLIEVLMNLKEFTPLGALLFTYICM